MAVELPAESLQSIILTDLERHLPESGHIVYPWRNHIRSKESYRYRFFCTENPPLNDSAFAVLTGSVKFSVYGRDASKIRVMIVGLLKLHPTIEEVQAANELVVNVLAEMEKEGCFSLNHYPCYLYSKPMAKSFDEKEPDVLSSVSAGSASHETGTDMKRQPPTSSSNYIFSSLKTSDYDIDMVNDLWTYKSATSRASVEANIRYLTTCGVRDSNGELMAWCLEQHYGGIGMLHTREQYRNKRLAELVVKRLCDEMQKKEPKRLIYCFIVVNNTASLRLFEKMGFVRGPIYDWPDIRNLNSSALK